MENDISRQVLGTVNALLVSADMETSAAVEKKFKPLFAFLKIVSSAEEGLAFLETSPCELVITDYYLPVIDGMEFAGIIKKNHPNMPIIMISDYLDMQFLITSMNIGITQFVAKPIQFRFLRNAINIAVERVVIDNLQRKAKAQELELLQYREANRSMQQELAFRKELRIIRNDLFMSYYDPYKGKSDLGGWNLNVFYGSKDFLCGDSYACRKLSDGSVVVFITDAMGKGISASITSILAVSVVNYSINEISSEGSFDLHALIKKYTAFVQDNLLEEEVMCSLFLHLDFNADKMRYASFTMPRLAVGYADGRVEKFICNNLPIMNFNAEINISEVDIKTATRIIAFSDGLVEANTVEKRVYSPYLRGDFIPAPFLSVLENNIKKRVTEYDDDTTIVFMNRPFAYPVYKNSTTVCSCYEDVRQTHLFLFGEMAKNSIEPSDYHEFFTAFAEAVMNAYEHGNLNISKNEKHVMIEDGSYESELLNLEKNCDKKITLSFAVYSQPTFRYMIAGVRDEGDGYPIDAFKRSADGVLQFCGRGVKMISFYTDSVFLSEDRKEIFLAKNLRI